MVYVYFLGRKKPNYYHERLVELGKYYFPIISYRVKIVVRTLSLQLYK